MSLICLSHFWKLQINVSRICLSHFWKLQIDVSLICLSHSGSCKFDNQFHVSLICLSHFWKLQIDVCFICLLLILIFWKLEILTHAKKWKKRKKNEKKEKKWDKTNKKCKKVIKSDKKCFFEIFNVLIWFKMFYWDYLCPMPSWTPSEVNPSCSRRAKVLVIIPLVRFLHDMAPFEDGWPGYRSLRRLGKIRYVLFPDKLVLRWKIIKIMQIGIAWTPLLIYVRWIPRCFFS